MADITAAAVKELRDRTDMPMMTAKSVEEYQANRTASTDIALGYSNHVLSMIQTGTLEPSDWAAWAPNVQDPRLLAPGGTAVTIQSSLPGITYNSQRFSGAAVPRSLEDVLKPQYKGYVGATPYAAWFDHLRGGVQGGETQREEEKKTHRLPSVINPPRSPRSQALLGNVGIRSSASRTGPE